MRKMLRFFAQTVIWAVVLCHGRCQDPDFHLPDMENWVDPGDMLNYDTDTGTMKNQRDQPCSSEKQESLGAPEACDAQLKVQQQLQNQLQMCQVRLQTAEQTCQSDQQSPKQEKGSPEAPYVRRFVRGLLKQLGDVKEPTGDMHEIESVDYDVHMTVTAGNWLLLKKFSKGQGSLQDTMQVFETLITGVSSSQPKVNRWQKRLEDYTGLELQILLQAIIAVLLVLCLVSLEIWSHVSWRKQFLRLFLLGFLISVGWTWMHEYKRAIAKKQREISKEMPRECRTAERTAFQGMYEWAVSTFTLQEDKCAKYHEALVVDAFWEVTPTKAFAVTLTKFFLEPMEHIGRSFSKFFEGVFHDLPPQLWPFAFLAVMLMSLLLMIMLAGYSINIPFIFNLQPRTVNTITLPLETQTCMEDTRQQVLQIIDMMREQQRAVIADGPAPHVRVEQQRGVITDGTTPHLRVEQIAPTVSQADAPGQEMTYNQAQNRINLSRGVSFTRSSSASSRPLAAGPHNKAALLQRSYSAPIQEAHRDHAQKIPDKEDSEPEETEASTETLGSQEGRVHDRDLNVSNMSLD
ncbi:chloride channel CLIC-like protein 1 [Branchiostoma floridae x Branchiostoma belcheri]